MGKGFELGGRFYAGTTLDLDPNLFLNSSFSFWFGFDTEPVLFVLNPVLIGKFRFSSRIVSS